MSNRLLVIILLMFFLSCSKEGDIGPKVEDFFYVETAGAQLPVKVRGNTASGKILLFIPGGPGGTGLDVSELDPGAWRQTLEKDYAVAYYDQRGIGNAQGRFDEASVTLDQYVDDIQGIVKVLHHRYPNTDVYLMGHSFGAMLVYRYINTYGQDELVKKYIAAAGVGSRLRDDEHWIFRRAYVEGIALERVDRNQEAEYWREVLDWLARHPVINTIELRAKLFEHMQKTQIEEEIRISAADVLNILLFSDNNFFPYYLTLKKRQRIINGLVDQERQWDVIDEIPRIDQPILLIGGEFDISVPPQELTWIYENIASEEKSLTILPDAGHDHYISQPQLFYQAVAAFVE